MRYLMIIAPNAMLEIAKHLLIACTENNSNVIRIHADNGNACNSASARKECMFLYALGLETCEHVYHFKLGWNFIYTIFCSAFRYFKLLTVCMRRQQKTTTSTKVQIKHKYTHTYTQFAYMCHKETIFSVCYSIH